MEEKVIDHQLEYVANKNISPYFIKFGLIAGFIHIILSIIIFIIGEEFNKTLGYILMLVPIIAGIIAANAYKSDNQNRVLFGSAFKLVFMVFLVYSIIGILYFIFHTNVLNPEYYDGLENMTRLQLEESGLDEEFIESSMSITNRFITPQFLIIMMVVGNILISTITALITAAIIKTPKEI